MRFLTVEINKIWQIYKSSVLSVYKGPTKLSCFLGIISDKYYLHNKVSQKKFFGLVSNKSMGIMAKVLILARRRLGTSGIFLSDRY
jgi:hypothetical protein